MNPDRFFDELRQTVFYTNTRTQIAYQYRAVGTDQFHTGANLIDGCVVLGRARLLAQAHKRSAEEALHLGILFGDDLLTKLAHRLGHRLAAETRVQIGDLAQSDGRTAA